MLMPVSYRQSRESLLKLPFCYISQLLSHIYNGQQYTDYYDINMFVYQQVSPMRTPNEAPLQAMMQEDAAERCVIRAAERCRFYDERQHERYVLLLMLSFARHASAACRHAQ